MDNLSGIVILGHPLTELISFSRHRLKGKHAFFLHLTILLYLLFFTTHEFVAFEKEWLWFMFCVITFYIVPGKAVLELMKWDGPVIFWFPIALSLGFFLLGGVYFALVFFFYGKWIKVVIGLLSIASLIFIAVRKKNEAKKRHFQNEHFNFNHIILYLIIFSILHLIPQHFGPKVAPQGIYSHVLERHSSTKGAQAIYAKMGLPFQTALTPRQKQGLGQSAAYSIVFALSILSEFSSDNLIYTLYVFWPICYLALLLIAYNIGIFMDSELFGLLFALFVGSLLFHFNLYHGLNYLLFSKPVFMTNSSYLHYCPVSLFNWLMLLSILTLHVGVETTLKRYFILSGILILLLGNARVYSIMGFWIGLGFFMFYLGIVKRKYSVFILVPFVFIGIDIINILANRSVIGGYDINNSIIIDLNKNWHIGFNGLKEMIGSNVFKARPNLLTWMFSLTSMTLYHSGIGLLGLLGILQLKNLFANPYSLSTISTHILTAGIAMGSFLLGMTLYMYNGAHASNFFFMPFLFLMNFYSAWFLRNYRAMSYIIIALMLIGIFWQPWLTGKPRKMPATYERHPWGTRAPIKNFDSIYAKLRLVSYNTSDQDILLWLTTNKENQKLYPNNIFGRLATGRFCFALPIDTNFRRIISKIDTFNIDILFSTTPINDKMINKFLREGLIIKKIRSMAAPNSIYIYRINDTFHKS